MSNQKKYLGHQRASLPAAVAAAGTGAEISGLVDASGAGGPVFEGAASVVAVGAGCWAGAWPLAASLPPFFFREKRALRPALRRGTASGAAGGQSSRPQSC